jgi:hypothetical protein
MEALEAGAKHRAVGLVAHAPGDVHHTARIDAEDVAVQRHVVGRAQRQPVDHGRDALRLDIGDDVRPRSGAG